MLQFGPMITQNIHLYAIYNRQNQTILKILHACYWRHCHFSCFALLMGKQSFLSQHSDSYLKQYKYRLHNTYIHLHCYNPFNAWETNGKVLRWTNCEAVLIFRQSYANLIAKKATFVAQLPNLIPLYSYLSDTNNTDNVAGTCKCVNIVLVICVSQTVTSSPYIPTRLHWQLIIWYMIFLLNILAHA